ncbi:MAG: xanthine dehydrogenase family protein molybdopterin-binding subunit [bacterium]|nr:xanthine dehydrogenase family protein molybdopterin-binding subunit [bacterium]
MAEMKEWGPRTLTGKDIQRVDAVDKVTGRAKYTYDINLPGLLIGKTLRSPYPHAKVLKVDLSQAAAYPGVKAVLDFTAAYENGKTLRYAGEEIAAVAAESAEAAEEALRLIQVDYEELPFSVVEEESMRDEAPKIHPRGNVRVPERRQSERGDIVAGFAEADAVIEATYRIPVQTHTSLETHGVVAKWDGGELTVWSSTQGVVGVKNDLAKYFKMEPSKVRVLTEHMGGGFGSKFGPGVEGMGAARLAKLAHAPVKMMMTRKEEHLCVGNRPSAIMNIKMGAKKDGTLTAFHSKSYGTGGVGGVGNIPLPYVFRIPNRKTELQDVHINAGAARAMRAPGHPQAGFGMDSAIDELAEALGMDPLEFRKANNSSQNETRLKQYEIGAERIGWNRRNKVAGSGNGPLKRGMGMGCGEWGGRGRKGTFAEVSIHADGSVDAKSATQDIGTGIRTLVAMVAAEELGLTLEEVRSHVGDTAFPPGRASGGSTTTSSTVPAVKMAARTAKQQLFERVAPVLGVAAESLVAQEGKVVVTGGDQSWSWKEVTAQLGGDSVVVTSEWDEGFSGNGVAGVHFAEVEVDIETGRIQPIKIVAVNDCGLVVDKLTAESQVNGGVIGALSYVLLEGRVLDEATGLMVNADMENYKVAGALEMPVIEPIMMDMPERGVIGLGEPTAIPTMGALANAVYNAIGVRLRELPMTPDKVLAALGKV